MLDFLQKTTLHVFLSLKHSRTFILTNISGVIFKNYQSEISKFLASTPQPSSTNKKPTPSQPSPQDAQKRRKKQAALLASQTDTTSQQKAKKSGIRENEALDMLNWMDRLRMEMEQGDQQKAGKQKFASGKIKSKFLVRKRS